MSQAQNPITNQWRPPQPSLKPLPQQQQQQQQYSTTQTLPFRGNVQVSNPAALSQMPQPQTILPPLARSVFQGSPTASRPPLQHFATSPPPATQAGFLASGKPSSTSQPVTPAQSGTAQPLQPAPVQAGFSSSRLQPFPVLPTSPTFMTQSNTSQPSSPSETRKTGPPSQANYFPPQPSSGHPGPPSPPSHIHASQRAPPPQYPPPPSQVHPHYPQFPLDSAFPPSPTDVGFSPSPTQPRTFIIPHPPAMGPTDFPPPPDDENYSSDSDHESYWSGHSGGTTYTRCTCASSTSSRHTPSCPTRTSIDPIASRLADGRRPSHADRSASFSHGSGMSGGSHSHVADLIEDERRYALFERTREEDERVKAAVRDAYAAGRQDERRS
ncbi:hypothetical protein K461DRAFT_273551 [Myriangium duriaei CBS 260.36]|uniref:Uncharacterized protein n=1 Tax=Myriangium duriaei CBS 260.36 TaxID=1168546 RepID=A0A9P4JE77_9PEZI|nr:hypothetical protein K461DRAFT_273551 [Myriangium duriaei CBS 260.36]